MAEVKAKLKQVGISPKKMRLVADVISGLDVVSALDKLPVVFKKSAPIMIKLLKSAAANAEDRFDLKPEDLTIKSIIVNKGMDLKRWRPAAFGRAHPYSKHFSHVEIVLESKEGVKVTAKAKETKEVETVDLTKQKTAKPAAKVDTKKKKNNKDSQPAAKSAVTAKAKDKSKVKKG